MGSLITERLLELCYECMGSLITERLLELCYECMGSLITERLLELCYECMGSLITERLLELCYECMGSLITERLLELCYECVGSLNNREVARTVLWVYGQSHYREGCSNCVMSVWEREIQCCECKTVHLCTSLYIVMYNLISGNKCLVPWK